MEDLENLSKKQTLKFSPHNHGKTWGDTRDNPIYYMLEYAKKTGTDIMDITHFEGDPSCKDRYLDWTSKPQLKQVYEKGWKTQIGEYYLIATKEGTTILVGKSIEVPTTDGHILISGLRRDKKIIGGKSLEETLKKVTDNELIIADHLYSILGGFGLLQNAKDKKRFNEIIRYINAFEFNGNYSLPFSLANLRAKHMAEKLDKPLLYNPDGHNLKDIGNTYNIFCSKNLDFSSEKELRDSIKKAVLNKQFNHVYHQIPINRILEHIIELGSHGIKHALQYHKYKQSK